MGKLLAGAHFAKYDTVELLEERVEWPQALEVQIRVDAAKLEEINRTNEIDPENLMRKTII
jgi:hypothetical protein